MKNERVWRPSMEIEREWKLRGHGKSAVCKNRITELSRELWTGRGSATSRQWSGTQACHKHHGNQRDCSSGRSIDWKRYVKDKWVNKEARTLDPEWRDPAGRALAAGSVDHEEPNLQDQLKYQVNSQSSK